MKKTLIAASVGALMLAAAGTASANSLLFPFFTTAGGATSILSISGNNALLATGENLHYVYNYGPSCTHYDGAGKITPNDLLQHSVAAPAAGGFGKVVALDKSTPFYFPLNDYGFMVVSNTSTAGVIAGDMAIADPASGLIVSYAGITNNLATNVPANEGNFTVAIPDQRFNLSLYPTSLVSTSWYGAVAGNMSTAIAGGRAWQGTATLDNQSNAYDNDENVFSGFKSKKITCAGIVQPSDLMTSAQLASVGPNGGLIHTLATPVAVGGLQADGVTPVPAGDTTSGVVMTKLQVLPGKVVLMHREGAPAF